MTVLILNDLALQLVARDFSYGHSATNAGPTKTSRALAIIHIAARDAYAKVTSAYSPFLAGLPAPPAAIGTSDAAGTAALLGAGVAAAQALYPDDTFFITANTGSLLATLDQAAVAYGASVAAAWLQARANDSSNLPQLDSQYRPEPGKHRPDPTSPTQLTLGRNWGKVTPFVLSNIATDAPLGQPDALNSQGYANAFDDVFVNGRDNIAQRSAKFQHHASIGLFWGYDGSNLLGTPPRLYNQVIRATTNFNTLTHPEKVNVLAAINVSLADAGIAAWYWKYAYDFWRPVVAIREADKGWGPTGQGDGNTLRKHKGDPFWLPLGAPRSNPFPGPAFGGPGANFTPNFPAYPSGHATFGTAAFTTFAKLIGKPLGQIKAKFVSDEFNGHTTDNQGVLRPRWEQTFSLKDAIEQNSISRIYLGVHWIFDATGGENVGTAVANKVAASF